MDQMRMTKLDKLFTSRTFAKLEGYKLLFNKKAFNGDFSYANIVLSEKDFVEGVLYECPEDSISNLDGYEGAPYHYTQIVVTVKDGNANSIEAISYIANPIKVVDGLLPTQEYLNYLLAAEDLLSPRDLCT